MAGTREGALKAWDVRGRKGESGSATQSRQDWNAKSSSPILSYKGMTKDSPEVMAAATKAHEKAKAAATELDRVMRSIEAQTGGELAGFDFRIKSAKSIADKAIRDAVADDVDPREAIERFSDLNRYTLVFDSDRLVSGFEKSHRALLAAGFEPYDTKHKNYFAPGGVYNGYNTVYVNKRTGQRFELQFHTQETITIKDKAHILYEQYRSLPKSSDVKGQRQKLWSDMMDLWSNYKRPPGWENLPGVLMTPPKAA